jgi:hypothetical protein
MLNVPVLVNTPLLSEPLSVKLPAFVAVALSKLVADAVPASTYSKPPLIDPIDTFPLPPDNRSVPVLNPPMLLNPAPAIPTEPPLIPVNVAVPPMLSVPVLNTVPNTKLLDTTVKPLPLKLVILVVPLDAL